MAETLALALLGNPELRLAGQPLPRFRSAKVYALLYYLAMTRRAQARTVLAGLFWGDIDEYYARRNFSRTLSDLTQFVGDYLVIERQSVAFAHEQPHWLDVAILESAATTTPTAHNVAALAAAANLYRGDFLDGFYIQDAPAFEQWVLTERTRLRAAVLQLFHTLADYEAAQGKLTDAMAYTRRILQLEPWYEEAHRQLMMLLAQSGQRAAALAQFELCRQALSSELNVDPDADTQDLVARIRTGKIDRVTSDRVTSDKVTSRPEGTRSVTQSPWHNLPGQRTPFVGRAVELTAITRLLAEDEDCRLLTLVGPGGMGKTQLALKAAATICAAPSLYQRFADGAAFVPLASVATAQHVPTTIADALHISLEKASDVQQRLLDALQHRHLLLLLDNFEHLLVSGETGTVPALALLQQILDHAPQVRLLVTSRERLRIGHERIFELAGLTTPEADNPTPAGIAQADAVALFVERAQRATGHFALTPENSLAVARICAMLNGMPLALELAAAWTRTLACDEIADEIQRNIDFLALADRDMEARHRSMRAVFDHSWALLSLSEQQSLAQLAVFAGGCRREAAQKVAGANLPLLAALIDKSLVEKEQSGLNTRYTLHELVRQYCLEQLQQSGQESQTRRRHLLHYVEVAEQARPHLRQADQVQWLVRLEEEHDNLRAALAWALDNDEVESASRISWSIWVFWWLRNYLNEGRHWSEQVLVYKAQLPLSLRIRTTVAAAAMTYGQGDLVACDQYTLELRELSRQANRDAVAEAFIHMSFGLVATLRGDLAAALHYLLLAIPLLQEASEEGLAAQMTSYIGTVHLLRDDDEQALPYFEAGLAYAQRLGDRQAITTALFNLGQIALVRNELTVAKRRFTEGLPYVQALGERAHIANFLEGLAAVAGTAGDHAQAAQLFGAAEGLFERAGVRGSIIYQPYYARYAPIRSEVEQALGSVAYMALWNTGRVMTLTEMVALGLA